MLFLLFNLERRVELRDAAVLELFQELARISRLRFQLLVVKVVTRAEVDEPQERLLTQQTAVVPGLKPFRNELYVHELSCKGSHDGWRFSDETDLRALKALVELHCPEFKLFASAPNTEFAQCNIPGCPYLCTWLAGHCCHRCMSTGGSSHGPRCDRWQAAKTEPKDRSGYAKHEGTHSTQGTLSRAERFAGCLARAQAQQQQRPGSLQLQTSALRRLQRCFELPPVAYWSLVGKRAMYPHIVPT